MCWQIKCDPEPPFNLLEHLVVLLARSNAARQFLNLVEDCLVDNALLGKYGEEGVLAEDLDESARLYLPNVLLRCLRLVVNDRLDLAKLVEVDLGVGAVQALTQSVDEDVLLALDDLILLAATTFLLLPQDA